MESICQAIHILYDRLRHMQQSCLLFLQSHHLGQFQKSHFQRKIDNHTVRKIPCIALRMLHLKLLRLFYFISAFTPYGSIKFAFWCKLHGFFIILITHNKYIHNLRCAASRHTYKLYHKTCKQFYAIFFIIFPILYQLSFGAMQFFPPYIA